MYPSSFCNISFKTCLGRTKNVRITVKMRSRGHENKDFRLEITITIIALLYRDNKCKKTKTIARHTSFTCIFINKAILTRCAISREYLYTCVSHKRAYDCFLLAFRVLLLRLCTHQFVSQILRENESQPPQLLLHSVG